VPTAAWLEGPRGGQRKALVNRELTESARGIYLLSDGQPVWWFVNMVHSVPQHHERSAHHRTSRVAPSANRRCTAPTWIVVPKVRTAQATSETKASRSVADTSYRTSVEGAWISASGRSR
jgi:hypothetical protein